MSDFTRTEAGDRRSPFPAGVLAMVDPFSLTDMLNDRLMAVLDNHVSSNHHAKAE